MERDRCHDDEGDRVTRHLKAELDDRLQRDRRHGGYSAEPDP